MGSTVKLFKTAANGKLAPSDIESNFDDLHPILSSEYAVVEASRCLYCFDAPCLNACPTEINIPKFIKQIYSGDADGAATTILSENILGGTCARACPTEELCEEVCVVTQTEGAPVKIGQLQRFAVEGLIEKGEHPFRRAPETGRRFAVVGAGPAGLAFAHRFTMLGNSVVIFEKREKPGGLNEYGLAEYKMAGDFAQREVAFLLQIGGIEMRYGKALGENIALDQLKTEFDGVFIGVGLGDTRKLPASGVTLPGVEDAVEFIDRLRQAPAKADVSIGANVVVIGGGNTAIDAAIQARCLGAQNVTIAYRRGAASMSATAWEQQLAAANGVNFVHWASPHEFVGKERIEAVVFNRMELVGGALKETGEKMTIPADCVFLAIGQAMSHVGLDGLTLDGGKISVNEQYQTSVDGIYAGGDCTATGVDLTVQAVEDGKQAAICADALLRKRSANVAE